MSSFDDDNAADALDIVEKILDRMERAQRTALDLERRLDELRHRQERTSINQVRAIVFSGATLEEKFRQLSTLLQAEV